MRVTIHKEGRSILFVLFLIITAIDALLYFIAPVIIFFLIAFATAIFFILVTNFFRNPHRIYPEDPKNAVIAPSDGEIVAIEEVYEGEYFKDKRIQVSIFMTVLNVHAQWYPMNGEVLVSEHHNGRFMAAYLPKSSTENERSTVVIKSDAGKVILMRQIAGAIARRIVTYAHPGTIAKVNQQLGFIKFGSRVDLFLPLGSDILVKMHEKVTGDITTIARLK
ncbi:MAG: phosphatidylserine decarboxylase family protein [Bacteroidales bacterium]|nr:phosphatidylserine decarboxylase family protein [Bacteroidales bacterium]